MLNVLRCSKVNTMHNRIYINSKYIPSEDVPVFHLKGKSLSINDLTEIHLHQ